MFIIFFFYSNITHSASRTGHENFDFQVYKQPIWPWENSIQE